jgi:hypothetical protein
LTIGSDEGTARGLSAVYDMKGHCQEISRSKLLTA